jgi:hypothetical protein
MARGTFIGGGKGIVIEDVGGSFAKFLKDAPRIARAHLHDAVEKTAFSMAQRMKALAPVGPDAPHIRDAITYKRRGQRAEVGLLDATQAAAHGSDWSLADVGLFNEYSPNRQPFMLPAAEQEDKDFVRRVTDAMQKVERDLSGGGGLM